MVHQISSSIKNRYVSMKQLKNGQFSVDCVLDGKRSTKKFKTERLANEFVEYLNSFIKGKRKLITNLGVEIELGRCIFEMLEFELGKEKISASSYNTYLKWHSAYFEKDFGLVKLNEIDDDFLLRLKKKLENGRDGKSNGSRFHSAIVLLLKVKKYADLRGYINISSEVELASYYPNIRKKAQNTYTIEDYNKALRRYSELTQYEDKIRLGVLLLNMQLGLRIGELVALKWADIDFKNKSILINKTMTHDKTSFLSVKEGTKTNTERVIEISEFCADLFMLFKNLRTYQNEFIFPAGSLKKRTDNNFPVDTRTMARWLEEGAQLADLPKLNSHNACRKTMATIVATELSKKGIDPFTIAKQIQTILGHKSMTTTMEKYIFPISTKENRAIDVFANYDKEKSKKS